MAAIVIKKKGHYLVVREGDVHKLRHQCLVIEKDDRGGRKGQPKDDNGDTFRTRGYNNLKNL